MPVKLADGRWRVDMRPDGAQGRRVRKTFPSKLEALRFEAWVKSRAIQGEWNPKPADNRKLSDLVKLWYRGHGQHLRDGDRRYQKLLNMCTTLGDPVARLFRPADFSRYRDQRIKAGITAKTCNNEHGYLDAVFNELHRIGDIAYANPLAPLRQIKISERELTWLDPEKLTELLQAIDADCDNPHLSLVTRICLATGARWGEAESLRPQHLQNGCVNFTDTKSGKNRTIPIAPQLYEKIRQHFKIYGGFSSSMRAFRKALLQTKIKLPKGQSTHVLRHSFASHFVMSGGNILTLQKILGHQSVVMTMRYAHLAPEHLQDAVHRNPISGHYVDTVKKDGEIKKQKSL